METHGTENLTID